MEPLAEPRRGRRRTRSARSLTDGVETLTSPRAALVRQESQKEAKRTRRALDDWRAAQTELAAIEAELRSTRIAIAALQPELEPQPEPQPQPEPVHRGLLTGKPAAAVTAARDELDTLRRHHELCLGMLMNPPVAPSPGRANGGQRPVAELVAEEETAQRRRRAQLAKVEALVASIEAGQIDPEDLVGLGPSKEEVMRDILPVAVPRRGRVPKT
jgi:DNA-binding protein H-NS